MKKYVMLLTALCFIVSTATFSFASKTTFQDGNRALGQQGTVVTAAYLNSIMAHRHDNINSDGHAPLDYASDSGSANTCVVNLPLALTSHITGMPIWFKVNVTNTGATTIQFNSLSAVALENTYGNPLVSGDLQAGQIIQVTYDGSQYRLTSSGLIKSQADSLYQPVSTAINTSNIGSQSVNFATTSANSAALAGQPQSYYQAASTAISTSNIGSQSVNYATTSGTTITATNATGTGTAIQGVENSLKLMRGAFQWTPDGTVSVAGGYNTAFTVTRISAGIVKINFTSSFANAANAIVANISSDNGGPYFINGSASGQTNYGYVYLRNASRTLVDPSNAGETVTFIVIGK